MLSFPVYSPLLVSQDVQASSNTGCSLLKELGFFSLLSDHNEMKLYIPGRYIPVLCVFCHMSKFLICLYVYVA